MIVKVLEKDLSDTFIRGYSVPDTMCDDIVKAFNSLSDNHRDGTIAYNSVVSTDKDIKDSIDVGIGEEQGERFPVFRNYFNCILKFAEDYAFKEFSYCMDSGTALGSLEQFNIQYYPPGGGYKVWHCEKNSSLALPSARRHLVFMTFLNNVEDVEEYQGGTEFLYPKIKIKAKKGHTLIWPVEWMYTHRGIVSPNCEKFIVTGWLSYLPQE